MTICELFLGGHKWEEVWKTFGDKVVGFRVCRRWFCSRMEALEPRPVPEPGPENNDYEIVPEALYVPMFTIDGAVEGKLSVWRPTTSKGKSKVVWPTKYVNRIAWCTCFADGFQEKMRRAFPNESSNRPRFYASADASALPPALYLRLHVVENGQSRDVWTYVANTRERMG